MTTLTVFTPTYNRAYVLGNCYESLRVQTSKDFVWLIIDDGSTDNTQALVEDWIKENAIPIRYVKQGNMGMHGAHNTAYKLIDTELNVCIDSDDYMAPDAVEKIVSFWCKHRNENISGIVGLDSHPDGRIIGSKLPEHLTTATLFELYNKWGVKGDKKLVYRSDLTRLYEYPIFENEKYVGLAYKYYMLDRQYKMLLFNETLCYVEYREDGSTKNMLMQYRKNPMGFAFYRKELMALPFGSIAFKFRQATHYVSSSLMQRTSGLAGAETYYPFVLLAYPFGIALYCYIMYKTNSQRAHT